VITYEARDGTVVLFAEEFTTEADERAMIATASPRAMAAPLDGFTRAHAEEAEMSRRATDAQRAITWGDCATRVWCPARGPVTIWGTITPLALVARDERDAGAGAAEVIALIARLEDGYARGWRYGRWHSVISPEGEYGAAHIADLTPVSVAEFDAAQWNGWRLPR